MRPWVLKLGGSLNGGPHLREWLDLLGSQRHRPLLVVPGGGAFADTVRQAQTRYRFDDAVAHRMALLAMVQNGFMLAALAGDLPRVTFLSATPLPAGSHVWLPLELLGASAGPGQDWDHTSDSIALWLAQRLASGRLLLVKSVAPESGINRAVPLAADGVLDAAFPRHLARFRGECNWLGPDQPGLLARVLAGEERRLPRILP